MKRKWNKIFQLLKKPSYLLRKDGKNQKNIFTDDCVDYVDESGECQFSKSCRSAWCDENNIVHDGNPAQSYSEPVGAWNEDLDTVGKSNF